jgi:hypothetical protein
MTLILQISHFWPAQQRNHHYYTADLLSMYAK